VRKPSHPAIFPPDVIPFPSEPRSSVVCLFSCFRVTVDILSLNLSRAVQISADIGAHLIAGMEVSPPDTMGRTFDLLAKEGVFNLELASSLKKAVGFRNIAVHNYESINWEIVHSIAKHHPADPLRVCQGGCRDAGEINNRFESDKPEPKMCHVGATSGSRFNGSQTGARSYG
jgi:hypothetical protein